MCKEVLEAPKRGKILCKFARWISFERQGEDKVYCDKSRCQGSNCNYFTKFQKEIEETVKKAQAGDQASIDRLIDHYKNFVFQMEKRYFIPGGDREDLYQEGFIGLYNAIKKYRHDSTLSFEDYVSLCIRNSVIRAVRSATQKKQMVLTNAKSIFEKSVLRVKAKQHCPEEATFRSMMSDKVNSIVKSKLSHKESEILKMKMIGFSAGEIASRFNTRKKTVDNALYRARNKIKSHLNAALSGSGSRKMSIMRLEKDRTKTAV